MNIVNNIQKLLKSYTRTISQSTETANASVETYDIMGKSLTDPFSYGLIFEVMGKSLTNFSLYEPESSDINISSGEKETLTEVDWMEVDEEEDDYLEDSTLSETVVPGFALKDFEALEGCISGENEQEVASAIHTVSRLKGSGLYEALKGNVETRQRITSLLSKVEAATNEGEKEALFDMTDFLITK